MRKPVESAVFLLYLFDIAVILLLLFSALNIKEYLSPFSVLGASKKGTYQEQENEFWMQFLSENPGYIPGLIRIGDFEKVREINPNLLTP